MNRYSINININEYLPDELNEEQQKLVAAAFDACKLSYAPYSKFKVGAAVLLQNGEIIQGSNQENVAYPSGLCAERVAMFYTNSRFPNIPIVAICVASNSEGINKNPISPCGACRQALLQSELRFGNNIKVLMAADKIVEVNSIKDLLPLAFSEIG